MKKIFSRSNLSQTQETLLVLLVMGLIFIFYWNWKWTSSPDSIGFCVKDDSIEIYSYHSAMHLKIDDFSRSTKLDTINIKLVHINNGAFFYGQLSGIVVIPINNELKYINVNDNLTRIDTLQKCNIPLKTDSIFRKLAIRSE
jgi:hypothetical protein